MTVLQSTKVGLPLMNLLRFKGIPILQQLQLEEQLLRNSSDNWCIINDGTNASAIVMGLSGKASELVEIGPVLRDQVPVIRRFTGGGTVIVDNGTIFVTLICNKAALPAVQPYPRSIMSWSSLLYGQVFQGIADFQLRENDYVFGDRKFGGNAQSITKGRWVHHTSFLWDYDDRNMAYLKLPSRIPKYRLERDHNDFICRMKDYLARSVFIENTVEAVEAHFSLKEINLERIDMGDTSEIVKSTRLLMNHELEEVLISPPPPKARTSIPEHDDLDELIILKTIPVRSLLSPLCSKMIVFKLKSDGDAAEEASLGWSATDDFGDQILFVTLDSLTSVQLCLNLDTAYADDCISSYRPLVSPREMSVSSEKSGLLRASDTPMEWFTVYPNPALILLPIFGLVNA